MSQTARAGSARKRTFGIVRLVLASLVLLVVIGFVFLHTPDVPRPELHQKYSSLESQFIDLPSGVRAHVRDQGNPSSHAIALIHGSSASLHTWEPWIESLGDDFRLVTLDLPGHGLTGPHPRDEYSTASYVSIVDEVREHLDIQRWSVAGSSMGGGVAWHYAAQYPDSVQALVLIGSVGPRPPSMPEEERGGALAFRLARTPGVNLLLQSITPRSMIAGTLEQSFGDPSRVTDEMVDRYWELLRHPGNREATRLRMTTDRPEEDSAAILASIKAPVLVMSGEQDNLVPVEIARHLDSLLPRSELLTYPGVGHIPMEEIPEKSAADLRDFMSRTFPTAGQNEGQEQDDAPIDPNVVDTGLEARS